MQRGLALKSDTFIMFHLEYKTFDVSGLSLARSIQLSAFWDVLLMDPLYFDTNQLLAFLRVARRLDARGGDSLCVAPDVREIFKIDTKILYSRSQWMMVHTPGLMRCEINCEKKHWFWLVIVFIDDGETLNGRSLLMCLREECFAKRFGKLNKSVWTCTTCAHLKWWFYLNRCDFIVVASVIWLFLISFFCEMFLDMCFFCLIQVGCLSWFLIMKEIF